MKWITSLFIKPTVLMIITPLIFCGSSQQEARSPAKMFQKLLNKTMGSRLEETLKIVDNEYVDPSRVDMQKMFVQAVKELSLYITELSYQRDDLQMNIQLDGQRRTFSTQIGDMKELKIKLNELLDFGDAHHKGKYDRDKLEEFIIAGVLGTLDPHSIFLSAEMLTETNVDIEGKFGGLGIVIGFRDGHLTVISPLDGTPADRARIKAGDRITKIEGTPTGGMTLFDAVSKMRGLRGTPVNISILSEGAKKEVDHRIVRDIIEIINTEAALLSNNIGYIKLKRFDNSAAKDVAYGIQNLQAQAGKDLQGFILDLRNNPGGLLDQAIKVSDLFLEDGAIVSTVERNNKFSSRTQARRALKDYLLPMTVLINQGSASASEIVAGALQKNNRALLIGQKTFGKGTVQKIFKFPKFSAVKLTVSKYLTVDDISIQSVGVRPDIEINPVWVQEDFIRFFQYLTFRSESEIDGSFSNSQKSNAALISLPYLMPSEEKDEDADLAGEYQLSKLKNLEKEKKLFETFEIKLAHQILSVKNLKAKAKRDEIYQAAQPLFKKIERNNQKDIQLALKEKNINWTYPPQPTTFCDPKNLIVKSTVKHPLKKIRDGEKIDLQTQVTNQGACAFYQVKGISNSKNQSLDQHFVYVGYVGPKQKLTLNTDIEVSESQPMGMEKMDLVFSDTDDRILNKTSLNLAFDQPRLPKFHIDYEYVSNAKQPELRLKIKNVGNQLSEEVLVVIKNEHESPMMRLTESRKTIDELKPAQTQALSFPIQASGIPNEDEVLKVQCADVDNRVVMETSWHPQKEAKGTWQSPTVRIDATSIYKQVTSEMFTLKGNVQDDGFIKDLYIIVNDEKVYYEAFTGKQKLESFSVPVLLKEEANTIQIVSRDSQGIQGFEEIHISKSAANNPVKPTLALGK